MDLCRRGPTAALSEWQTTAVGLVRASRAFCAHAAGRVSWVLEPCATSSSRRAGSRRRGTIGYHASVSAESRLHPRFDVDARADLIGEEVVLSHPIADISLGGCRFGEPAWEVAGTVVQIVLTFPTLGANLPLTGRVVRATDHDMGLRFENLSDEQKWALRKHIRDVQRDKS
jgi:hypothetical protein